MTGPGLTRHAQARLQQRAIPPLVIELLERFGSSLRGDRADILFFDGAARKRLRHHLGGERSLKLIAPWLNAYLILADNGRIETVAYRYRRFQRDRCARRIVAADRRPRAFLRCAVGPERCSS